MEYNNSVNKVRIIEYWRGYLAFRQKVIIKPAGPRPMAKDIKKFGSVEEVLDFAISREVEAYDFYMKLAKLAKKPEIIKIIRDLAIDEKQHKIRLEAAKAGEVALGAQEVGRLGIANYVEDVKPTQDMSYVELLAIAMKKEDRSYRLYTDLAAIAQKKELKEMFLKLAQEEAEHKLQFEFQYDLATFQKRDKKR